MTSPTLPPCLPGCVPWPESDAKRYRTLGCWTGEPLGNLLDRHVRETPSRVALVSAEQRWTYAELDLRASQLAAGLLRLGIRARDRVAVQLPNSATFFTVIFALFRMGALPVFILPAHRYSEMHPICKLAGVSACIMPDVIDDFDYRELARQLQSDMPGLRHVIIAGETAHAADGFTELDTLHDEPASFVGPNADEVAFLQLSGGTTGLPKLIPRTPDDYLYSVRVSARICGLNQDSVYLCVLPAAHNFPLSSPGTLGTLYAGGCVVMARSGAPEEAFPLIQRERVTLTAVVPPLALVWLDAAASHAGSGHIDLSSLELLQVGGARFSEETARRVRPVLGCGLQQVFGMAEGLVNYTRLEDPEEIVCKTQGRPLSEHDEIRVVDSEDRDVLPGQTGHLLTRGPYTIRGYYQAEEHNIRAFTPCGYYRTGDIVRCMPGGYLVVEGRAKDQINRGGDKIAAEEIEHHLLAHPDVLDAALVAMPDAYLGEKVCAFVVMQTGKHHPCSAQHLSDFLRSRSMAQYKIPDHFEFLDRLPQTPVGKVNKRTLREQVRAKLIQPGHAAAQPLPDPAPDLGLDLS